MKNIVVTGGAGFIGYHLVKKLLDNPENKVFILDNFSTGQFDKHLNKLATDNVGRLVILSCDLYLERVPTGLQADEVYHLAGVIGTKNSHGDPFKVIEINTISMLNLLHHFGRQNCKMVFTSTNEVYFGKEYAFQYVKEDATIGWSDIYDKRWSYAYSKFACEMLLIRYNENPNFKYSIARLSNVYGERTMNDYVTKKLIERMLNKENPFNVYNSNDFRPFTYVQDTVEGLMTLMKTNLANGKIVNIGNQSKSILELAETIAKYMDYKPEFVPMPTDNPEIRTCDNSLAKTMGWKPEVDLEEGIKRTVEWSKDNK